MIIVPLFLLVHAWDSDDQHRSRNPYTAFVWMFVYIRYTWLELKLIIYFVVHVFPIITSLWFQYFGDNILKAHVVLLFLLLLQSLSFIGLDCAIYRTEPETITRIECLY